MIRTHLIVVKNIHPGGRTMRAPRRHFLFGSLAAAAGLPARAGECQ